MTIDISTLDVFFKDKNILIITGKPATGKTLIARHFEYHLNAAYINGRSFLKTPFKYQTADKNTQLIIIDDLPDDHFTAALTIELLQDYLTVNQQGKARFKIHNPKFIITTNKTIKKLDPALKRKANILSL